MLATDLADYLVRRAVPFREAHHLVGRAVAAAERAGLSLSALPLADYRALHPAFGDDLLATFDYDRAVDAKRSTGGTGRAAVEAQIAAARVRLTG